MQGDEGRQTWRLLGDRSRENTKVGRKMHERVQTTDAVMSQQQAPLLLQTVRKDSAFADQGSPYMWRCTDSMMTKCLRAWTARTAAKTLKRPSS